MTLEQFKADLNWYLDETGMSKKALASKAKVCQSQISDWSNGKGVRFTEKAKSVANIIEDYRNSGEAPIPQNIEDAVREVWQGDEKCAEVIANLVYSLKPITNS